MFPSLSRTRPGQRMGFAAENAVLWLAKRIRPREKSGELLPSQRFFLLGTGVMLVLPHEVWSNLLGVAFAVASLGFYWRDCAAYGLSPENPARLGWGVWGFLILCYLSCLWADSPLSALRVAIFYDAAFSLAYVAMGILSDRTARDRLYAVLFIAMLISSVYGFLMLSLGRVTVTVAVGGAALPRLCGTLEHGINYSEFLALAFPPVLLWCLGQKKSSRRVLFTALLLLPLAALLLTYARTGWLAVFCAFFVLMLLLKPVLLLPAGVLAAGGVFLLPAALQERLLSVFRFTNTSASGRFVLWRECMGIVREHWLTGIGLGSENFLRAYLPHCTGVLDFTPPHTNMGYMEMLTSLGIAGLFFFGLFFFGLLLRLGKKVRSLPRGESRTELAGLFAAFLGIAAANLPEYVWFYPRVLFLWCLLFGLALRAVEDACPESDPPSETKKENTADENE